MEYRRKMRLMQDLQEIKERNEKEYLSSRVTKGKSGNIASTQMRDKANGGGSK